MFVNAKYPFISSLNVITRHPSWQVQGHFSIQYIFMYFSFPGFLWFDNLSHNWHVLPSVFWYCSACGAFFFFFFNCQCYVLCSIMSLNLGVFKVKYVCIRQRFQHACFYLSLQNLMHPHNALVLVNKNLFRIGLSLLILLIPVLINTGGHWMTKSIVVILLWIVPHHLAANLQNTLCAIFVFGVKWHFKKKSEIFCLTPIFWQAGFHLAWGLKTHCVLN